MYTQVLFMNILLNGYKFKNLISIFTTLIHMKHTILIKIQFILLYFYKL